MDKRNEMQEFFMDCVSAVKKDIQKRCQVSLGFNKKKLPNVEISHQVDVALFSEGDKRKVIDRLMSNENVLLFLYDKIFPTAVDVARSPQRLVKQKPSILYPKYPEIPMMMQNIAKAKINPSEIAKPRVRPGTAKP